MSKLAYVLAAFLILIWAAGFFVYSLGAIVHLLLIVAVVSIVMLFARRDKNKKKDKPDDIVAPPGHGV